MNITRLVCYAALISTSAALAGSSMLSRPLPPEVPPMPADTYAHPVELVEARRFTVEEEIVHTWRNDGLKYSSGWLMVVKAAPGLVAPRQGFEPVLYVGAQTANRVHSSPRSGHIVAIVPGDFLLTDAPIFFGDAGLPEILGQPNIDQALARALDENIAPPSVDRVAAAVNAEPLHVSNHYFLNQAAVDLVEKHSPEAVDFVRGQRVPLIR